MKLVYLAPVAALALLAACEQQQETTMVKNYSALSCSELEVYAAAQMEVIDNAKKGAEGRAVEAVTGVVGGVAASAPVAGMAMTSGAISGDMEQRDISGEAQKNYDDAMAAYTAKGCA